MESVGCLPCVTLQAAWGVVQGEPRGPIPSPNPATRCSSTGCKVVRKGAALWLPVIGWLPTRPWCLPGPWCPPPPPQPPWTCRRPGEGDKS